MSTLPRWVLAAREARLVFELQNPSTLLDSEKWGYVYNVAPQTQERLERALELAIEALNQYAAYTESESPLKLLGQPAKDILAAIEKLGDSNG